MRIALDSSVLIAAHISRAGVCAELLEDLDGIDPTFDAWLTTERERLRDRARNVAEALLREQIEPEAEVIVITGSGGRGSRAGWTEAGASSSAPARGRR